MSVTQPNVTIALTVNTGCTGISLEDTTGLYNAVTNTGGYGLPSGPAINDVTGVVIVVTYNLQSNSITYDFTLVSGVITAATLAIASGTPASILSLLPSTVWPFTDPFDLSGDYGITIPTFEDDIFSVSYTISGTVSATPFEFEAIRNLSVDCITRCCIDKKWVALDPSCDCNSDKLTTALYGEGLLKRATYAAQYADLAGAVDALTRAKALCTTQECGCG